MRESELSKMYRIIEVANQLNVSKVTIYKKISALKPEIKQHIVKDKNITYLTEEGFKLIKESLKHHLIIKEALSHLPDLESSSDFQGSSKESEKVFEMYLNDLIIHFDYLKGILKGKQERLAQTQMTTELLRKLCKEMRNNTDGGRDGE